MNVMVRSGIRYGLEYPAGAVREEVLDWCRQHYGEPGFKERWMYLEFTIQFREKRDRDWFYLRWGT